MEKSTPEQKNTDEPRSRLGITDRFVYFGLALGIYRGNIQIPKLWSFGLVVEDRPAR